MLGLLLTACPGDDGSGEDTQGATGSTTSTTQSDSTGATTQSGSTGTDPDTGSTGTPGTTTDEPGTTSDSSGDSSGTGSEVAASAMIMGLGENTGMGSAVFTQDGEQVTLVIELSDIVPEGLHGTHIHEVGDCSAADGSSAGGHWNPFGSQHGMLGMGESHLGDLGNTDIDGAGSGTLMITTDQWTIGDGSDTDVIGRAIIVHEGEDDLSTSPNPGPRIACGVVVAGG